MAIDPKDFRLDEKIEGSDPPNPDGVEPSSPWDGNAKSAAQTFEDAMKTLTITDPESEDSDPEFEDVRDFHRKFNQIANDCPTHLTKRKLAERVNFMLEELSEFAHAAGLELDDGGKELIFTPDGNADQDFPLQADALIDLVYVAKGTAAMMGLPWRELWVDVHAANMRKELRPTPHRAAFQAPSAMVGKPEGWVGPKTEEILAAAGYNRWAFSSLNGKINDHLCDDDAEMRPTAEGEDRE